MTIPGNPHSFCSSFAAELQHQPTSSSPGAPQSKRNPLHRTKAGSIHAALSDADSPKASWSDKNLRLGLKNRPKNRAFAMEIQRCPATKAPSNELFFNHWSWLIMYIWRSGFIVSQIWKMDMRWLAMVGLGIGIGQIRQLTDMISLARSVPDPRACRTTSGHVFVFPQGGCSNEPIGNLRVARHPSLGMLWGCILTYGHNWWYSITGV